MTPRSEAAHHVAAIRANVDAWYDGEITRAQFDANQRRLWGEIAEDDTTHHNVLALLRDDPGDLL